MVQERLKQPVEYLSLNEVLKKYKLRVPSYQRPFAWRDEQVQALLDDIAALGPEGEQSRRFLGYLTAFQSPRDESTLYLIDGQQRITSMSLLYAVVCDEMKKLKATSQALALEQDFLFLDLSRPSTYRFLPQDCSDTGLRQGSRGSLQSIYRHVLAGDTSLEADADLSSQFTPAARRLLKVREKMRQWVQDRMGTQESIFDMLSRLSRLDVVLHRVANDADGAEIFDGINNRGKHLSDIEKIKSYSLYLYNKSLAADTLTERIEKTNDIFERTYYGFDKYDINDDKSETQFVDSYYHCFADHAGIYLQTEGAAGAYSGDAKGAASFRALLPVVSLRSNATQQAILCLDRYLDGIPKAVEWFGDVARVQKNDCYLDYKDSSYQGELVAISQCLKLLRRSTIAAPLVMAFRKANPADVEGLIALLRYLERMMFQLSLEGRQVNKGAALINKLARDTVLERLDAPEIIRRIHDQVALEEGDNGRLVLLDEELASAAESMLFKGQRLAPATLYAHYHWLKLNKFKVSFYGLRKAISRDAFHFVVKPTRFGKIHQTHEDNRSKLWRDHPANFIHDSTVAFSDEDIDLLKDMDLLARLDWLSNKYPRQMDYFSLKGAKSATWLERKGEAFTDWFVKRWSLANPQKLPAVRITLHDIDFDSAEDDDVGLYEDQKPPVL